MGFLAPVDSEKARLAVRRSVKAMKPRDAAASSSCQLAHSVAPGAWRNVATASMPPLTDSRNSTLAPLAAARWRTIVKSQPGTGVVPRTLQNRSNARVRAWGSGLDRSR